MKKKLMLAIILLIIMMPVCSFARTAINDNDLDNVTAQAGVNIDLSNLRITNLSVSRIAWGDTDGVPSTTYTSGYTSAGYFGVTGVTVAYNGSNSIDFSGPMNIDAGTSGGQTRMQIGLPSIIVGGASGMNVVATLRLDTAANLAAGTNTLAYINATGLRLYLNGTVTVYAH